jgi:hypothetical protein
MSQRIKIVVTAETAEAAAALRAFVEQSSNGLKSLAASGASSAESLRQMRESAMGLHEGFRILETGVYLLGGQRFPQLASAVLGARSAVMLLRTAMQFTGLGFQELFLPLLAISSAVSAGFALWETYGGSMETAEQKAKKLSDTLAIIPKLLNDIADSTKRGILSSQDQAKYQSYLSGATPLYVNPTAPGELTEQSVYAPQTRSRRVAPLQLQRASMPEIVDWIGKKNEQERLASAQKIAAQDVAEEQKKAADEAQKQRKKIDQQDAESRRKQVTQENQIREEGLKQFSAANQVIEKEITNEALGAGKDRQDLWQEEYQRRIVLAQQAVFSGQIDEQTYKQAILDAQNAMYEGQKKYNAELAREAQLKQEIARADIEANLKSIQANPFLSREEKQRQALPDLYQLQSLNTGRISELEGIAANPSADIGTQLEAQKQLVEVKQQQAQLEQQILTAEMQTGTFAQRWTQNWRTNLAQVKNQWGDLATTLSNGAFKIMEQGVSGVSHAITGLIMGTKNAGQAFKELGMSLLSNFISTILEAVIYAEVAIPILTTLGVLSGGATAEAGAAATSAAIMTARGVAMGGMLAGGGPYEAGMAYVVGEKGPELMIPDHNGMVIPNGATQALLSGGGSPAQGSAAGGSTVLPPKVVAVYDKQGLMEELKKPDYAHITIMHVLANKTQLGLPT